MEPRYINTLNLNSLFVLKRRTKTHHNTFVQMYPLLSFPNHMAINNDLLITLVYTFTLILTKLIHVDQTMTQTHHAPTPLLFYLSPRYQLSNIETSALTSKDILLFNTVISNLSKGSLFNTYAQNTFTES